MTDPVPEQLSACLDGELPRAELDLLLKRVSRDAGVRETVGRYALISEALKGGRPTIATRTFADRVMAAVEQEPAPARAAVVTSRPAMRFLRPAAGLAVAAAVAAMAVLSVQQMGGLPGAAAPEQVASSESDPAAMVTDVTPPSDESYVVPQTSLATPAFFPATRLTNYVVAHSEYSSPLGRRSMLSGVLAEDDTEAAPSDDAAANPTPQESAPDSVQER